VDRENTNVISDQLGVLPLYIAKKHYPDTIGCVTAKDDKGKRLSFLTNNMTLKPELIADLYCQR
jgi:ribonucleotide monophosphatase NagD (HAD superfamily)